MDTNNLPVGEIRRKEAPTETTSEPLHLALRPRDAALALGISERLLWAKTKAGEIPHCRIGRTVVYPVHLLQEWLTQNATCGNR